MMAIFFSTVCIIQSTSHTINIFCCEKGPKKYFQRKLRRLYVILAVCFAAFKFCYVLRKFLHSSHKADNHNIYSPNNFQNSANNLWLKTHTPHLNLNSRPGWSSSGKVQFFKLSAECLTIISCLNVWFQCTLRDASRYARRWSLTR